MAQRTGLEPNVINLSRRCRKRQAALGLAWPLRSIFTARRAFVWWVSAADVNPAVVESHRQSVFAFYRRARTGRFWPAVLRGSSGGRCYQRAGL